MLDVTDDHLIMDGLEDVWLCSSVQVRLPDGKMKTQVKDRILVKNALQRRIDERDTLQDRIRQSVGKLRVDDVIWELWHEELMKPDGSVFQPSRPMIIVPVKRSSEQWEILAVDNATIKNRFRVFARK